MQPERQKKCSKLPSAMLQVDWHHVGILATSVAMHRFARSVWHSGMPCTCCTDKLLLVTLKPCLGLLHNSIACHASFQVSMPVSFMSPCACPCHALKTPCHALNRCAACQVSPGVNLFEPCSKKMPSAYGSFSLPGAFLCQVGTYLRSFRSSRHVCVRSIPKGLTWAN